MKGKLLCCENWVILKGGGEEGGGEGGRGAGAEEGGRPLHTVYKPIQVIQILNNLTEESCWVGVGMLLSSSALEVRALHFVDADTYHPIWDPTKICRDLYTFQQRWFSTLIGILCFFMLILIKQYTLQKLLL